MTDAIWDGVRERVYALTELPLDERVFGARGRTLM